MFKEKFIEFNLRNKGTQSVQLVIAEEFLVKNFNLEIIAQ